MLPESTQKKINQIASNANRYVNRYNILESLMIRGVVVNRKDSLAPTKAAILSHNKTEHQFSIEFDDLESNRSTFARILGWLIIGYGWDYQNGRLDIKDTEQLQKKRLVFTSKGLYRNPITKLFHKIVPDRRFEQTRNLVETFARDFLMPSYVLHKGMKLGDYLNRS